ncbi:putative transcription factor [Echria macrotheca]|uniref:General transcription and DNA repair factor IIH subunit TFB4 n=1 Tax=Echria macrotheca TaxID=438768 RepID=A0AAJ0BNB1_9PEZI|nr:putative transcription factor [Echria macrotheca]
MNPLDVVDDSTHYHSRGTVSVPNLLTIIIDTNPRAWAALANVLPLSQAIATIFVYANSHLAFSDDHHVALLASHCNRAVWLYPEPPTPTKPPSEDVEMGDAGSGKPSQPAPSANKFHQFAKLEASVLRSVRSLIDNTTAADVASTTTTQIPGALTLALAFINKMHLAVMGGSGRRGISPPPDTEPAHKNHRRSRIAVRARILIISVSDSSAEQYIPTMNAVFAAAHSEIPIDTLSLRGSPTFLQQASHITRGNFINVLEPRGLLQYLMVGCASAGLTPDPNDNTASGNRARMKLGKQTPVPPQGGDGGDPLFAPRAESVDFRAACFCHGSVIDTGFVCSICLSIFCDIPDGGVCRTCGTKLALGNYGARPAVSAAAKGKEVQAEG